MTDQRAPVAVRPTAIEWYLNANLSNDGDFALDAQIHARYIVALEAALSGLHEIAAEFVANHNYIAYGCECSRCDKSRARKESFDKATGLVKQIPAQEPKS